MSDRIVELSEQYKPLQADKAERRVARLERMTVFYRGKVPVAPSKQANMFTAFVGALAYAITVIRMYQKLTDELAEEARKHATTGQADR